MTIWARVQSSFGAKRVALTIGLNQKLFGVDGFVAKITVSVLEILLNYLFSKYLVFNHKDKE